MPPLTSATGGMLTPVPVWLFSTAVAPVVPPITGASLRGAMVVDTLRSTDHWLVASLTVALMSPLPAATGASDTRTTSPPGVPLKSAAGTKRSCALVGSSKALVSEAPVGTASQSVPFRLYSHAPCAALALLPTMAMPPNEVDASPPPLMDVWLSVASP
ncbi:hypothetical protein D3C87_916510 [compost metagenome]